MSRPSWYTGPYIVYWNNDLDEQPHFIDDKADDDEFALKIDGGVLYLRRKESLRIIACAAHLWSGVEFFASDDDAVDIFPHG